MAGTMDPYKVLGVSRSATKNEIKEAFRRLALQLHPDKHSASSDQQKRAASHRFKQVSDAYQVLVDDARRAGFDHRPAGAGGSSSHHGGGHCGYARSHRHADGRGANSGFSFKVFTSRNLVLNLALARKQRRTHSPAAGMGSLRRRCRLLSDLLRRLPFDAPGGGHISYSYSRTASSLAPAQEFNVELPKVSSISPNRVQKLIARQSDPLMAKEIFDLADRELGFRHCYSAYHTLICKLARARHHAYVDALFRRLRAESYPVTPGLFSDLVEIYAEANLHDRALYAFHLMLSFDCKPLPKHLNRLLGALVDANHLPTAFSIFKSAARFGISPNSASYNILMRAFCRNDKLSIAFSLINAMFKRDVQPDIESYRIIMQGLCRKSQVNRAVDLLEDMLNKGYVPGALSYTTLLNSLCRKMKLREAYRLLCRMKVKGCNPDIVHYNTVILGFCREGRPLDACKVFEDMPSNGCLPNLVSYRTIVVGLCDKGLLIEAKTYLDEMLSKDLVPYFSEFHSLIAGFCNVGKMDEASSVLGSMLKHNVAPHVDTWYLVLPRVCCEDDKTTTDLVLKLVNKNWKRETRIIDAGFGIDWLKL